MASVADATSKIEEIKKHIDAQEKKVAEVKESRERVEAEIILLYQQDHTQSNKIKLEKLKEERAKNIFDIQDAETVLCVFKEQLSQAEGELQKEVRKENINKYNKLAEQRETLERDIEKVLALLVGNIDKLKSIDAEQRAVLQSCKINSGFRAVSATLEDYLAYKLRTYFSFFPRTTVQGGLVEIDNMNKKINL